MATQTHPTTSMAARLHDAINARRPRNGYITGRLILCGWTAQPAYRMGAAS
jgi:hypothetical protein